MAVAQLGMLDLSVVTDQLIAQIEADIASSPIWAGPPPFHVDVSGSMPEAVRADGFCQVSFYLFHVSQDPYQLNVPMNGPLNAPDPPPASTWRIPFLPLPLDLHYLLTAYADKSYVQEQQAMSVAMRSLHEHPILTTTVVLEGVNVSQELTVMLSQETPDELGRLWQAVNAPLRLAAVYRVSVVLITPEAVTEVQAPAVERVVTAADAAALPLSGLGSVSGTSSAVTYGLPDGSVRPYDFAPAVAAAGDRLVLHGAGLDRPTAARIFLLPPGQPRVDVTAWRTDGPPRSPTAAQLLLPNAVGLAPAATPPPGIYRLQVGTDTALGDPQTYASDATPFSIAPRVDVGAGPPLLAPVAGVFSLAGAGLVAGQTQVLLGTVSLTEGGGPPAAGTFAIVGGGTAIDLRPPASLAPGRYAVRVRVNDVEARPAWWVDL